MIYKVGITGGIGSGKTTVCKLFQVLGAPVFYADQEASLIMEHHADVISGINTIAGQEVYTDGVLNRPLLARLIFNNKEKLAAVNSLVHPVVFQRFQDWAGEQNYPYVIMEAAILLESGAASHMDLIITVIAPVEERIARVMGRSNITRQEVEQRIRNQMNDDERIKVSGKVLMNSDSDMVIPEVLKIHREILESIK